MLLRKYIRDKLAAYYAQPSNMVIGYYDGKAIDFSRLWGEAHFRHLHRKLYKARRGQWMTPVELFKPHYSYCFADYVANDLKGKQQQNNNNSYSDRVEIIELGAGRGTNANLFLTRWQDQYPDLYEKVIYTVLDSSPTLHEHQKEVVGAGSHGCKVKIKLVDLLDVAEKKEQLVDTSDVPTYVMAFEVLDNLPHDKISYLPICNNKESKFSPMQAEIIQHRSQNDANGEDKYCTANDYHLEESFVELCDPLLRSIVDAVPSALVYSKTSRATHRWIPSVACGILNHLFQTREDMHVILADFDWLPTLPDPDNDPITPGSPLITCMDDIDHSCYLNSPYMSDILFPTDFDFLAKYIKATIIDATHRKNETTYRHHISIMKQGDFLNKFGEVHVKATKSWLTGYSPLLGDFANCSILTASNTAASVMLKDNLPAS